MLALLVYGTGHQFCQLAQDIVQVLVRFCFIADSNRQHHAVLLDVRAAQRVGQRAFILLLHLPLQHLAQVKVKALQHLFYSFRQM